MVIKKYYSGYTGEQIDEAVKAIIDNQIQLEDLSPELVAEIKKWIVEGGHGENKELRFSTHYDFPNVGETNCFYIATDEDLIYYWKGNAYVAMKAAIPDINCINGGEAKWQH